MLESLNRPNIKNIVLEEIEPARTKIFDPDRDIPRSTWDKAISEINLGLSINSTYSLNFLKSAANIKKVSNDRFRQIQLPEINVRQEIKQIKNSLISDPYSFLEYYSRLNALRTLFPDKAPEVNGGFSRGINYLTKAVNRKHRGLTGDLIAEMSPLFFNKRSEFEFARKELVEMLREGPSGEYGTAEDLLLRYWQKVFAPELQSIYTHKPKDVQKAAENILSHLEKHKDTWAERIFMLTIVTADSAEITPYGIFPVYNTATDLNNRQMPYPEMDRTESKKAK